MGENGRRWLKYGCGGCAGLVILLALAVGVVSLMALNRARSEAPEPRVITPEIERHDAVLPAGQGLLRLDLRGGEFHLVPAPAGERLRVEASFDPDTATLEERLERHDDGSWTYEVGFRGPHGSWIDALASLFGRPAAELWIHLPQDLPVALEVTMREGHVEGDLGGLDLSRVELDTAQGGTEIRFGSPLQRPLERFTLKNAMGGGTLGSLGNASPRQLDIENDMGGLDVDLRGAWLQDAQISIRSRMGGGSLRVPDDVNVIGVDTEGLRSPSAAASEEVPRPTLDISLSFEMGNWEVVD